MPPRRLLVIDENLPRRLSTELTNRGRSARRLSELGLKGANDVELLTRLAGDHDDWILVTADDRMPLDHAETIEALGATIATVDPRRRGGYNVDQWWHEIGPPLGPRDPRAGARDGDAVLARRQAGLAGSTQLT